MTGAGAGVGGGAGGAGAGAGAAGSGGAGSVLACGLATLDVVQRVDHVPGADEKVVAQDLLVAAGGPAANAAVTAAALGVPARLLTRIGGAPLGLLVAADLAAHGVQVTDLAGPHDAPALSTVLVTAGTGERAVVSINATMTDGRSGTPSSALHGAAPSAGHGTSGGDLVRDLLDGVGCVLVDGHHLDLAIAVATAARASSVPVLLDGGSWKPGLEHLLALVDVALVSADLRVPDRLRGEGGAWGDGGQGAGGGPEGDGRPAGDGGPEGDRLDDERSDELDRLLSLGPSIVARSRGAASIEVRSAAGSWEVAVPSVEVVDTLGAGDVLHGALAAWLARGGGVAGGGVGIGGAGGGVGIGRAGDGAAGGGVGFGGATGIGWAATVASASCAAPGARAWAEDPAVVHRLRSGLP